MISILLHTVAVFDASIAHRCNKSAQVEIAFLLKVCDASQEDGSWDQGVVNCSR